MDLPIVNTPRGYWLCTSRWQYDHWDDDNAPASAFTDLIFLGPNGTPAIEIMARAVQRAPGVN
jgi:hypothetical protein